MNTEERLANLEALLPLVERELADVKRRNRRLLIAGLAGAGVAALSVIVLAVALTVHVEASANEARRREEAALNAAMAAARAPYVVRANGFILVDADGKVRATLTGDKNGPALRLCDENGKVRAGLGAFQDGPWLSLFDENEKGRAVLDALKDGPTLRLFDENGKGRAQLGAGWVTTADGRKITYAESSMRLFTSDGKVVWAAP
jgi:putative aminopeptidase FrvX